MANRRDVLDTTIKTSEKENSQTIATLGVLRNGSFLNGGIIGLRETLLDRLGDSDPNSVLNPTSLPEDFSPPPDLAKELKHTLDELKLSSMDESGAVVDYVTLRKSPAYTAFRKQRLAQLRRFDPIALPSIEAQRAFWINLYNVLILDAIISFDIQEKVIEGRLGLINFFRRAAYVVGGRRVSLNDIEQGVLRGNRGYPYLPGPHFTTENPLFAWSLPLDPRIHFALNCGSNSCPPIRSYSAEMLSAQLDLAAHNFVTDSVYTQPHERQVLISAIFRWYANDFGGRKAVKDFVIRYLPDDDRRDYMTTHHNYRIKFLPYDWRLNRL